MPKYTVVIKVNIPGHGEFEFTSLNVSANTLEEAPTEIKKGFVVETVSVVKTGV